MLGAFTAARERGCLTIGVSCVQASPLSSVADLAIVLDTGAEPLRGSTRLKAGTARKIVLNMLSTCTMARLGYVYGDLMVGLQPRNEKQRRRAAAIAGIGLEDAHAALNRCSYDLRQAIVVLLLGVDPADAAARLEDARGNLRRVLQGSV